MENISETSPKLETTNSKLYKKLRWQVFLSATIGYGLYYVCRLSLNVVKKPIVDNGFLTETELGIIGSSLFFAYAIGKFVNGFLADHSNIRWFMGIGLLISAIANWSMGFTSGFIILSVLWGINGWVQSMGTAPSVVALSRWFSTKEMGSFYGLWSTSHNIGEAITYIFTSLVVSYVGWRWGFGFAGIIGVVGFILIAFFLHNSPESKGLPSPHQSASKEKKKNTATWSQQKQVLQDPYIWILAFSSGFMYIARYSVTSWGPYYFEAAKNYSITQANSLVAISAVCGIVGTAFSGIISDKFFKGKRNAPVLLSNICNVIGISLFLLVPEGYWFIDILSMLLFGISIGALICYLGGMMAVDLAPKNAAGAALGVVGVMSYIAAGIQDIASGILIEKNKFTDIAGETIYNFTPITLFWIGAAIMSTLLPLICWRKV